MAKNKFKCAKCDRSFSMPAHLARHMNTIHGGIRRGRPKAAAGRRLGRPPGRSSASFGESSGGVSRLVSDMQAYHGELTAKREELETEIGAISRALDAMGSTGPAGGTARRGSAGGRIGRPPGRPGRRAGRAGSLKSFIVTVFKQTSRAMSPKDIAAAVRKAGYKSTAKDLTKAVSNTLPQLNGVKRLGFGQYKM